MFTHWGAKVRACPLKRPLRCADYLSNQIQQNEFELRTVASATRIEVLFKMSVATRNEFVDEISLSICLFTNR